MNREKGYTLLELLIAVTIMVLASTAAGAAIFQMLKNTGRNNDQMTATRQVLEAGYQISRDAEKAVTISADNVTSPDFLLLTWTEWSWSKEKGELIGNPVYHSAMYSFASLSNGTGQLKRHHWSSAGADEERVVAQYIYYDPNDAGNTTSKASYLSPVLTVRLTALYEGFLETKEYRITHQPNF